jgi:hypothetical protein
MGINVHELEAFCTSWLRKAKIYKRPIPFYRATGTSQKNGDRTASAAAEHLARSFDRFTTLYVVFDRICMEADKILIRRGLVRPPRKKFAPLPTGKSVTEYIVVFCGESDLRYAITRDSRCRNAIDNLTRLIRSGHIYLHEDYTTGSPDLDEDRKLVDEVRSYKPQAILSLLYQIRCNLFHGEKEFDESQRELLDNSSLILEFITVKALTKLKREFEP